MRISRLQHLAVAVVGSGIVACSDQPSPTELTGPRQEPDVLATAPIAELASRDPTSIPIGPPALVGFLGRTNGLRQTVAFSESAPTVNVDRLNRLARDWLADQRTGRNAALDAGTIQSIDRLIMASSPEDIRAALGPVRERVVVSRSLVPAGSRLFRHTASFRVDGREALKVVTRAAYRGRPLFECLDGSKTVTDEVCGEDDSNFDPESIVADLAAMQARLDAEAADLAALERLTGAAGKCDADRAAFYAAALAFIWKASETAVYAWRREVFKTYSGLRDSSGLLATSIVLLRRYKECMADADREDGARGNDLVGIPF